MSGPRILSAAVGAPSELLFLIVHSSRVEAACSAPIRRKRNVRDGRGKENGRERSQAYRERTKENYSVGKGGRKEIENVRAAGCTGGRGGPKLCWWPALALTHSIAHSILGREASQTTSDPTSPATGKQTVDFSGRGTTLNNPFSSSV